jgi:hypothetical protein
VAGQIICDSGRAPGQNHATLSAFGVQHADRRRPGFPERLATRSPTAMSICTDGAALLGIEPPQKFDGRVWLKEWKARREYRCVDQTMQATRKFPSGEWQQYLRVSSWARPFIDGNGAFPTKGDKK